LKFWITISVYNQERHDWPVFLSFQYHMIIWQWVYKFGLDDILIIQLRLKMTIMSGIDVSLTCVIVVLWKLEDI
jgi:hypothetical protein